MAASHGQLREYILRKKWDRPAGLAGRFFVLGEYGLPCRFAPRNDSFLMAVRCVSCGGVRAPRPTGAGHGVRYRRGVGEIGEAPPVAEEASRFRGSAPIGRHDSAGESAGTTVLPRRLSRIFRDRERVRRFCRSSSYTSCRSRRGRGRCGRSSAPGGAAFSRCRRRRRSRRWLWPPAHA